MLHDEVRWRYETAVDGSLAAAGLFDRAEVRNPTTKSSNSDRIVVQTHYFTFGHTCLTLAYVRSCFNLFINRTCLEAAFCFLLYGCRWLLDRRRQKGETMSFLSRQFCPSTINITPLSLLSSFARLNVTKHKIEQHR